MLRLCILKVFCLYNLVSCVTRPLVVKVCNYISLYYKQHFECCYGKYYVTIESALMCGSTPSPSSEEKLTNQLDNSFYRVYNTALWSEHECAAL